MKLNSMDLSDHVALRKTYCPKVQVGPVVPSTILHELLQIRSVLTHASVMWETPVDLNAFDRTTAQLRKTRQISASRVRDRLPTNDELKQLIVHFHEKWESRGFKRYPMHLIIRLAEKGFTIPQIQQCSLHDSWQSLQRYVSLKKSHIKFR